MEIRLRSTVGGFSPDFMRKLPELEKAMLAHGLEPSEFLISKDRASPGAPWITPFFYLYTVFVGDENFAVTEPTDERFFDYLYKRVIAEPEDDDAPTRAGSTPPRPDHAIFSLDGSADLDWASRTKSYSPHCRARVASAQPSQ